MNRRDESTAPAANHTAAGARGHFDIRGPLCLGGAAAIWGSMYVVSAAVLRVIPAFVLLELRFTLALAILGLVAYRLQAWTVCRRDIGLFAALGSIGFTISIGLQFDGTALSGAALGSLITSASPALIGLFAVVVLHERVTVHNGVALIVGLAGIVIVVGLPSHGASGTVAGNIALGLAALTWAAYTVGSRIGTRRYSSLTVTTWATLFGALFSLPAAIIQGSSHAWLPSAGPWAWMGVIYLGTVCTAGAFYLWNKGYEFLPATSGSLYFLAQPIVGGLLGWFLLGERLGISFLLGATCILGGVIISTRGVKRGA